MKMKLYKRIKIIRKYTYIIPERKNYATIYFVIWILKESNIGQNLLEWNIERLKAYKMGVYANLEIKK